MSVLHPIQVAEIQQEKAQLEAQLSAPPHIRAQIQNPGDIAKRIKGAEQMLKQAPRVIPGGDKDGVIREEARLRESWLQGMPTQAEMRKNPSGAVGKHIAWETRNKPGILKWKDLRREMQVSGMMDDGDLDVSNVERFRPEGGAQELNMHNTQIPGTDYHLPPPDAAPVVIFSEEDKALLEKVDPELRESLAILPNDMRRRVMDALRPEEEEAKPKTEITVLRAKAKSLGIKLYQKSKAALISEIEAKEAA